MIFKSFVVEQNLKILNNRPTLFYGENSGLQNDIKNKIRLEKSQAQIVKFNQEEILKNKDQFFKEVFNLSLFEQKKIFFIDNVNDKIFSNFQEVEEKNNEHEIYLFAEILDKKSKLRSYFEKSKEHGAVPCYQDNEITIRKILLNKLKFFKGLTPDSINIIIENSNLDRNKLYNEIEKILICFDNKIIENDKLISLLNLSVNDNFNYLKDEALIGNKEKTNKLINDTILESDKNIFYLNSINQRLHKLLEIVRQKELSSLEDAVNNIKPPIFWKDKPAFTKQAKKWDEYKIKKILKETYNLEFKLKSNSSINYNLLIKKLLIDVCNLANA